MRVLAVLVAFLGAIVCASSAQANRMADSVAFQGRLTDASDNPVPDGPRDLTLSIWTDPVAGTMLHSEVVVVTVSKGLYSTCIGCGSSSFFDIFTEQSLYLETQLAGSPPMTPRTLMRGVPFSISSSSLHGEVSSGLAKGKAAVSSVSGLGGGGGGAASAGYAFVLSGDADGDGLPEYMTIDSVTPGSASRQMSRDSDEDGLPDGEISFLITPTTSGVAIKQKGTGADKDRVVIQTTQIGLNPGTSMVMSRDYDDDGLMDRDITTVTDDTGARLAIKTKGTSAQRTVACATDASNSSVVVAGDLDGDGLDDNEASLSITPTTSNVAIKTKGTGADPNRVVSTTSPDSASHSMSFFDVFTEATIDDDCDATGARLRLIADNIGSSGQDGVEVNLLCSPDSVVESKHVRKNGAIVAADYNRKTPFTNSHRSSFFDVFTEMSLDQDCDITGSRLAIKTKGTSAQRTVACATDASTSSVVAAGDLDGDGVDDSEASLRISPTTSSMAIKTKGTGAQRFAAGGDCDDADAVLHTDCDDDGDGIADVAASVAASATRSELKSYFQKGDVPTQSQFSSLLDATGGRSLLSSGMSGSTTATIRMQSTPDSTVFDLGYHGSTTGTIRLQASSSGTANPIEHSSGAVLTVGGVWTNASDENLKENFKSVDGEELLEKIDELPIRQWNYKNESDDVTHIGPTAQDFQEAFGVGSDGKSISTIDPSGIALAAIKELNKQNQELKEQSRDLKEQNALLKKQLDELAKKVNQLVSNK